MKFCPHCESRMRRADLESGLLCPKCGYKTTEQQEEQNSQTTQQPQQQEQQGDSSSDSGQLNVLEEQERQDSLPKIKADCEKCGNDEAVWWMLQTRSADEPTTQFYRCTKCNYTWRNYA